MIAEPYICIKGPKAGEIEWFDKDNIGYDPTDRVLSEEWQRYAGFEREKLRELGYRHIVVKHGGYWCEDRYTDGMSIRHSPSSQDLIHYGLVDFFSDTESNRLLKRAEFLQEVCEKGGVEWLPKNKCPCRCHKTSDKGCRGCSDDCPSRPLK